MQVPLLWRRPRPGRPGGRLPLGIPRRGGHLPPVRTHVRHRGRRIRDRGRSHQGEDEERPADYQDGGAE